MSFDDCVVDFVDEGYDLALRLMHSPDSLAQTRLYGVTDGPV